MEVEKPKYNILDEANQLLEELLIQSNRETPIKIKPPSLLNRIKINLIDFNDFFVAAGSFVLAAGFDYFRSHHFYLRSNRRIN